MTDPTKAPESALASDEEAKEPPIADDLKVSEVDAAEGGESAETGGPPEVVPRIVEIEDRSGGAGSSLWAGVDQDGDGLADTDAQIGKTSTGTYYGDIDKDGYSEAVASDLDGDGRIDTVDTAGQGSSVDTVGAEQVVDPADDHLVDHGTSDADSSSDISSGADDDGDYDGGTGAEADAAAGSDTGADDGYDSGSSSSGNDDSV